MKPFKHGFNCGYILTSHKCCAGFLKLDDQHSAKRTEFTFFLSLLCLSASIRCLCFSSFFSIISFTCFTPSKVPFSSSSTYCSPAAESPAHTRGTHNTLSSATVITGVLFFAFLFCQRRPYFSVFPRWSEGSRRHRAWLQRWRESEQETSTSCLKLQNRRRNFFSSKKKQRPHGGASSQANLYIIFTGWRGVDKMSVH